jgi:hypothetical protein
VTFGELTAMFLARGFDYLPTATAEGYLNDAYLVDICEAEDWPFLEATTTGKAPLVVSDLRTIESVIDSTQGTKLSPLDRRHITDDFDTDLTTIGTPAFYYLTAGTTVSVYPANTTDTLSVRYWRAPPRLTSGDTPLLPTRFHSLIVDGAAARAYEDSDDYELSENAETKFQRRLQKMRDGLLDQGRDGPDDYIQITDPSAYC